MVGSRHLSASPSPGNIMVDTRVRTTWYEGCRSADHGCLEGRAFAGLTPTAKRFGWSQKYFTSRLQQGMQSVAGPRKMQAAGRPTVGKVSGE